MATIESATAWNDNTGANARSPHSRIDIHSHIDSDRLVNSPVDLIAPTTAQLGSLKITSTNQCNKFMTKSDNLINNVATDMKKVSNVNAHSKENNDEEKEEEEVEKEEDYDDIPLSGKGTENTNSELPPLTFPNNNNNNNYNHTKPAPTSTTATTSNSCSASSSNNKLFNHHHHHHLRHYHQYHSNSYKFLPKTQSLDLVDEHTNPNEDGSDESTESVSSTSAINSQSFDSSTTKSMMPKLSSLDSKQIHRQIFPNVPYSPYGSPRTGRRPPLRESRRVSIDKNGSFLQLNQYKLMDQIGQGSYGLVKLAYNEEDATHYAMKILSKKKLLRKAGIGLNRCPKRGVNTTTPLDRVYREIAVLKKLDHPNVVKLVEVLDDPIEDALYMVFELVTKGEVLSIPTKDPLTEERAWHVFRDSLLGVEYLHYQRIIHGDLKPENLLLGECDSVKVADLGVCNEFLGEDASVQNGTMAGTPAFRAPETLQTGQHLYNGKAADIWALGVTLYTLVYGHLPFSATSIPVLYEQIKAEEVPFPVKEGISAELTDLIRGILNKDPVARLTMDQIKNHHWITKDGLLPLPSEEENCRLVQISEEDINSVIKSVPKLDTLILIKKMLKNHSFQNPFMLTLRALGQSSAGDKAMGVSSNVAKSLASRISRLERFSRAGRSNSAPGDYHQIQGEVLPSLKETIGSSSQDTDSPVE